MDIYIIEGKVTMNEYFEKIQLMTEMEEKPKTYIGEGRKFNKEQEGKIERGLIDGSYKTFLTNPGKMSEARSQIREKVLAYNLRELKKYQASVDHIRNYDIHQEIKIRKY